MFSRYLCITVSDNFHLKFNVFSINAFVIRIFSQSSLEKTNCLFSSPFFDSTFSKFLSWGDLVYAFFTTSFKLFTARSTVSYNCTCYASIILNWNPFLRSSFFWEKNKEIVNYIKNVELQIRWNKLSFEQLNQLESSICWSCSEPVVSSLQENN